MHIFNRCFIYIEKTAWFKKMFSKLEFLSHMYSMQPFKKIHLGHGDASKTMEIE